MMPTRQELLFSALGGRPPAFAQPTRNEQLSAQQQAGQGARQDLLQKQAPRPPAFVTRPPVQIRPPVPGKTPTNRGEFLTPANPPQTTRPPAFITPVGPGIGGELQPIAPPQQPTSFQQLAAQRAATQNLQQQFDGVSGRPGNTPRRPPAFSARQFPSKPKGFNRASNLDLQRSGQQGRLALASRSGRSAPFANNFQFGARQGRGGRQPVFSRQDQAFRQRFQESQQRRPAPFASLDADSRQLPRIGGTLQPIDRSPVR